MADDKDNIYETEYLPYINRWGRRTNLLAVFTGFLPALGLLAFMGIFPAWKAYLAGVVLVSTAIGWFWVLEPISYFPVLGNAGTFISFMCGNISNLRLPCGSVAQDVAGVKAGTNEGFIISTIGVAASVFVSTTILTVGIFFGTAIVASIPTWLINGLRAYIFPAVFGAIFARFADEMPKLGVVALSIGLLMTWFFKQGYFAFLPGIPLYIVLVVCVFGTVLIGRWMYHHGYITTE